MTVVWAALAAGAAYPAAGRLLPADPAGGLASALAAFPLAGTFGLAVTLSGPPFAGALLMAIWARLLGQGILLARESRSGEKNKRRTAGRETVGLPVIGTERGPIVAE